MGRACWPCGNPRPVRHDHRSQRLQADLHDKGLEAFDEKQHRAEAAGKRAKPQCIADYPIAMSLMGTHSAAQAQIFPLEGPTQAKTHRKQT